MFAKCPNSKNADGTHRYVCDARVVEEAEMVLEAMGRMEMQKSRAIKIVAVFLPRHQEAKKFHR